MFVVAIVLFLLAAGALVAASRVRNKLVPRGIAAAAIAIGVAITFFSASFTQDVGQASVQRDWFGNIVGQETTQGLHWKAPWVDVVTFDVRNQRVVYTGGDSAGDNSGGAADGPQITVQDAEGVTANVDVAIRYSLDPNAVIDIYSQYLNEDNLRTRLINNDVRSVVRSVPGKYTTLELLTERDDVQASILAALEARWEDDGIIVEDVALQEIRYSEVVTNAYAEAQQAQINVTTEQAKLESTKVSAQQKVVQAQAEADANAILNASLTDNILRQRYLDTLAKLAAEGNLVITDGTGSGVLIQR